MTQSGIENYITQNTEDKAAVQAAQAFVDTLKDRIGVQIKVRKCSGLGVSELDQMFKCD